MHRVYGLDLVDFFRGRHTWRKLLVLVEQLPTSSAYVEAVANDEEYARQVVRGARDTGRYNPPLRQWSAEVDLLAQIVDRLGEVIVATIVAGGGKPPNLRPTPRPVTAIDRVRGDERLRKHFELVEEVRQAQARYAAAREGGQ